jgi:hypothetical protein
MLGARRDRPPPSPKSGCSPQSYAAVSRRIADQGATANLPALLLTDDPRKLMSTRDFSRRVFETGALRDALVL